METIKGYEIIEEREIKEKKSKGILWLHKKSGARIFTMENEDKNKTFYIAFRTPPTDSTGVAHILEHSVLCGSKKFPAKDPFIELAKGSLNTFLNAMTYPDKTVYPIASCNDTDFQNLMDVYLDAVFHPNIYREEKIFRQEGWHYELSGEEDEITLNGVVYNEMKGAFSSAEGVLDREIMASLFPDTPYGVESGGDPKNIPDLSYEQFLDFHRKYYHPSNSFIYLYGNMEMKEKLEWLDREYLSEYDRITVDSAIPKQEAFARARNLKKHYSIQSQESTKDKTYLSANYVISDALDAKTSIAFSILDYVLISSPGAILKKALMSAGIGKDIMGGYDSGILQPMFSIIAKDANEEQKEEFCRVIQATLEKLVQEGINKKTLQAGINYEEFHSREADFGHHPKGLIYGLSVLGSWLYDEADPFLNLETDKLYRFLNEKVETDYFEGLIREYLLQNPHSSLVLLSPEAGLTAKNDKETKERLKDYKDSLKKEQIFELIKKTKELEAYQSTPSPKEDLEKIPMLKRSDISKKHHEIYNEWKKIAGKNVLFHDIFTNKIVYLNLVFDLKHLTEEELPYISILKTILGRMSTKNFNYIELTDEINFYTGGISWENTCFSVAGQKNEYEFKCICSGKAMYENRKKLFSLMQEILTTTSFEEEEHLYEQIAQLKSRLQMVLTSSGHLAATIRAKSSFSEVSCISEQLRGVTFYRVIDDLERHFEERKEELKQKLYELMEKIFCKDNYMINLTCDKEGLEGIEEEIAGFDGGLWETAPRDHHLTITLKKENVGFASASKVQYVARCGNFFEKGKSDYGTLLVLKTILSYDYLWNRVRVLGGAYGCMNKFQRNGNAYFVSYRDPKLAETNEIYEQIPEYLEKFDADEREMTKYVIGTFSDIDMPETPCGEGERGLSLELTRTTAESIDRYREQILNVTKEDIRRMKPIVEAVLETGALCVIGNEEKIKEQAELFDRIEDLFGGEEKEE